MFKERLTFLTSAGGDFIVCGFFSRPKKTLFGEDEPILAYTFFRWVETLKPPPQTWTLQ